MNFKFEDDIILESNSLLLRPISFLDSESLLPVALSDPLLLQFSPKQVYNKVLLTTYVETAITLREEKQRYTFTIFDKKSGKFAGSTAFLNIANTDDRLEIGATWIDKKLQGTGLNRLCKHLLLDYSFDKIGAHRVEFKTDERNIQSRKAIERIGGKFEGILREHTVMSDGFRRNTHCYSILKNEWQEIKTTHEHAT